MTDDNATYFNQLYPSESGKFMTNITYQQLHTSTSLQKLNTLSIFHISINIPHFYKYITVMLLDYMNHLITTQVFSTPPK